MTPEEIEQGLQSEFRQNLFAYTNGGDELGEGPLDCDKVYDKLYILCGEARKVYQLDAKSFQLVHEFDYTLYGSDFVPQDLFHTIPGIVVKFIVLLPMVGLLKYRLQIWRYSRIPISRRM